MNMKENVKVLQICSYFILSKVHKSLMSHLDKDINQYVFVPVRIGSAIGANRISLRNGTLKYCKVWSWYHRLLYHLKIKKASEYLLNSEITFEYNIIHAHTWFSDGGIAWLLREKTNKPYIVTIRNTDINVFYKKLFFLRKIGNAILRDASKIVFLSNVYYEKLLNLIPEYLRDEVKNKSVIYPNGIDNFWLENNKVRNYHLDKNILNLLYMGEISRNKNVHKIIKSYIKLSKLHIEVTLTIVGFTKKRLIERYIRKRYNALKGLVMLDRITDKNELLRFYQNADIFIMPSITETFGLVYIEALRQGLPVVYSRGQGVDGYFKNINFGVPVNPGSLNEIYHAILEIYNNYPGFEDIKRISFEDFNWRNISKKYINLYAELANNSSIFLI